MDILFSSVILSIELPFGLCQIVDCISADIVFGAVAVVWCSTGRRRTIAVLLRLYTSLSSIAVAFSVTCIIRSELFLKVWTMKFRT